MTPKVLQISLEKIINHIILDKNYNFFNLNFRLSLQTLKKKIRDNFMTPKKGTNFEVNFKEEVKSRNKILIPIMAPVCLVFCITFAQRLRCT